MHFDSRHVISTALTNKHHTLSNINGRLSNRTSVLILTSNIVILHVFSTRAGGLPTKAEVQHCFNQDGGNRPEMAGVDLVDAVEAVDRFGQFQMKTATVAQLIFENAVLHVQIT
jgi:hypothetical protein